MKLIEQPTYIQGQTDGIKKFMKNKELSDNTINDLVTKKLRSMKSDNNKMLATLKELDFIQNSDDEFITFYKTYNDLRLFVKQEKCDISKNWIAGISCKGVEIYIPLVINEYWVFEFNEQNS